MKILVCLYKYLYFIPIIVIIVCFDKKFTLQEYLLYVRYKVLTVLLLKIHIRDVTVCHKASGSQCFEGFWCFCIKEQLVQVLILDSETVKNKAGRQAGTYPTLQHHIPESWCLQHLSQVFRSLFVIS